MTAMEYPQRASRGKSGARNGAHPGGLHGVPVARRLQIERERCALFVADFNFYKDCPHLQEKNPETGVRECSLETSGGNCLCLARNQAVQYMGMRLRLEEPAR